jgi:hypothetical protein
MTVGFYVPSAVPRSDETVISGGNGGIAENLGMMGRINSRQIARGDAPTSIVAAIGAILTAGCSRGAENAQGRDDCKRQGSFLAIHSSLLRCTYGSESSAVCAHGKDWFGKDWFGKDWFQRHTFRTPLAARYLQKPRRRARLTSASPA